MPYPKSSPQIEIWLAEVSKYTSLPNPMAHTSTPFPTPSQPHPESLSNPLSNPPWTPFRNPLLSRSSYPSHPSSPPSKPKPKFKLPFQSKNDNNKPPKQDNNSNPSFENTKMYHTLPQPLAPQTRTSTASTDLDLQISDENSESDLLKAKRERLHRAARLLNHNARGTGDEKSGVTGKLVVVGAGENVRMKDEGEDG